MKYKLKDICTKITDGSHNPPQGISDSPYLMLSSKNIADDSITYDNPRYLTEADFLLENKRTSIQEGDLLLTIVGTIGRVAVVSNIEKKLCLQRSVAVLKPKQDIVKSRYLMYYLQNMRPVLEAEAKGVAQKGIYLKQVESIEVSVPSLSKQEEIVNNLDLVTKLLALQKMQLVHLDELVKSRFIELFGDPIRNTQNRPTTDFINVVKMQRGFDLPVQDRQQDGDIPVFGSNGALDRHNVAKVQGGGVITGRSGTIGKVYYTEGDYWPLNTSLFSVDMHGNDIIYLAYLLQLYDLSRFTEGTGVPTLNRNKFHDKPIIDVPLNEQEQYAVFVKQTDKSKLAVQQSIAELEELKKSLMQKYFG